MHICIDDLPIIGSNNSFSPGRRQAIIWTNAERLLTEPLEINFSENFKQNSNIQENAFEAGVCTIAPISSRPQCVNTDLNIEIAQQPKPVIK